MSLPLCSSARLLARHKSSALSAARACSLGLILSLFAAHIAGAQSPSAFDASTPITLEAEGGIELDLKNHRYKGRGGTSFRQGNLAAFATEMSAQYQADETGAQRITSVSALGGVRVEHSNVQIFGDRLFYDAGRAVVTMDGKNLHLRKAGDVMRAGKSLEFWPQLSLLSLQDATFEGNDGVVVHADTMIVELNGENNRDSEDNLRVQRVRAEGHVVYRKADEEIQAGQADVDLHRNLITLEGGVTVRNRQGTAAGNRAEINLISGESRLFSGARPVTVVLEPTAATGR